MSRAFDGTAVDVTFYVPCLDEETSVGRVIEMLAAAAERHRLQAEVLVYDDGSGDRTADVARHALGRHERADFTGEVICNETSRGLGANFFAGANRARGERYLLVNGDHSERRETLDAVLSRLGDADLVVTVFDTVSDQKGFEQAAPSRDTGDVRGPLRRGLSQLFTTTVNRLSGHRLRYYNGPVLHRREDVVRFATDCRGFAYQAELLVRLLDDGRTYVEVPMVNRARGGGVTKAFRPRNLLSVARSLWRIRTRRFGPSPTIDPGAVQSEASES